VGDASITAVRPEPREDPRLGVRTQSVYALGDLVTNAVLASLSLVFATYFLTEIAGLRPGLAGLVPLIGRSIDAFFDPLMGRISDLTRWRAGRRRPYLLLGAVPYGASFALLWASPPLESQAALFAYYAVVYTVLCCSMSVLSVPYLALLPEMAQGYDARTSLSSYRNAGAIVGIGAAILIRPVAELFGGGSGGFAAAGIVFGLGVSLPWLAVWAVTWERPDFQAREVQLPFLEGLRALGAHRSYSRLVALFLPGRISMDLVGAMLLPFFTKWIGRSGDFEPMMGVFLVSVVISIPFWLRFSRARDKAMVFRVGALWWMGAQVLLLFARPEWPTAYLLLLAPLLAAGYAVVDLMPWAMLADVVDEDDLRTGERREGLYNGSFTFLRKLAGALAVSLALWILDVAGLYAADGPSEGALWTLRVLTSLGPALFLALSIWAARDYPLTRHRHARVLEELEARATRGDGT
jgi:Na+/melibiose symporter-like transporter